MNKGKALAIVLQIDSEYFTDEEKAEAIYLVMNMPTHMSITKDIMIKVIKWLWNQNYKWDEVEEQVGEG